MSGQGFGVIRRLLLEDRSALQIASGERDKKIPRDL